MKQESKASSEYTLYTQISDARILKNGNIVVSNEMENEINILDGATGEEIESLQIYQDSSSSSYAAPFAVTENKIITINVTGDKVIVYNTETQETEREIEIDEYSADLKYFVNSDETIYICSSKGISMISPQGTLWENSVDGALCSLNMPSIYLNNFMQCKTENEKPVFYCYVYDSSEGGGKIFEYMYDSTIPSVPSQELTVYSLEENKTVRQAIAEYQRENTDVKITYNVAMAESGSATVEDYIKALNTELLAGKGADVLILDGLPKDSYIEKGVLEDMSEVIIAKTDYEELDKNMLETYIQDGKVYCVPIRFSIPIVFGTEEAVSAGNSLKTLNEYTKSQSGERVIPALTNEALTKMLLTYYYPEIISKSGTIEESALGALLEQVKMTIEGVSEEEKKEFEEWNLNDMDGISSNIILASSAYLSAQEIKLGIGNISSIMNMMIPFEVINSNQYSYNIINHSYLPTGIAGINSASANKELAKDFISCLLSETVQSVNLYDGFPMNRNSLKKWIEEENDYLMVGTNVGEIELTAVWPEKEYREGLYAILLDSATPIEPDSVLVEKITQAAASYYSGESSKEETIYAIQSSISTYLAE